MKSIAAQDIPQLWPEVLACLEQSEQVDVLAGNRVLAKIIPTNHREDVDVPVVDFVTRASAIWGARPAGELPSILISSSRG